MADYHIHEAAFDMPAGWLDASLNSLHFKRDHGVIRLGVVRDYLLKRTHEQVFEEHLIKQRRKYPRFVEVSRNVRLVDNLKCIELVATYKDDQVDMYQRLACLLLTPKVVTLLALGPAAGQDEIDALFERAISTLEVRRPLP